MNGPSVSASAGRTRWALCSQIGLSSSDLLVDLVGERLADALGGAVVAEVSDAEVEAELAAVRVDRACRSPGTACRRCR